MSFYSRTCAQSKFVTLFKKKSVFSAHDSAPQTTGLTGSITEPAGVSRLPVYARGERISGQLNATADDGASGGR